MKTTSLLLLSFFLTIGINAFAQWPSIGVNLPLQPQSTTPSIKYSDYSHKLYLLTHDINDSSICSLDTIGLNGSNWGVFNNTLSAIDFITEDNGNLTFVRLTPSNHVELFSMDENGQGLWTETAIGFPQVTGSVWDIDIYQGINGEYYVAVISDGVSDIFKLENSIWSSMGFVNYKVRFDSSGRFTRKIVIPDSTVGMESITYNFEFYDGANWVQFESVTFPGLDVTLTDYTIDSDNKIYIIRSIPLISGGQFITPQFELYSIQSNTATQLGNTFTSSSNPDNESILLDRLENPHMFFTSYDLGWTDIDHRFYIDSVLGGSQIFWPIPGFPILSYGNDYPVAVDELNCLNFAYGYHTDLYGFTDSIKVAASKLCFCRFSPSENTVNVQLGQLISEITQPVDYQWLDCDNNFAIIPGETDSIFTPSANGNYALRIELDGCIDTTDCISITGVGINKLSSLNDLRLFPNPAKDELTIESNTNEFVDLVIYDLTGTIVLVQSNFKTGERLNLKNLNSGVYQITFTLENGEFKRDRFVKH